MGPSHTTLHWVCFTWRLFNSNNFSGLVALAEVCTLLSVILIIFVEDNKR